VTKKGGGNSSEVQVEIVGGEALRAAFKKLDENMRANTLRKGALAGGQVIRNGASRRAPRKSGNLRRSIVAEVKESNDEQATIEIGTNLDYAAIQEFGGTIVPKKAKLLAIPVTKTAERFAPREYPGKLHMVISGGMPVGLADASDKLQYALKRFVTIKAHPYLRPAFDEDRSVAIEHVGRALWQMIEASL
jgi:HK97 gp10 family phage protein